jgi:SSS family solute:Na+ symporter/sodium/pantothenate symporter
MVLIFVCAKTLPLEMEQSDQAMPAMAIFSAPPILAGMLIAAPFAAIMSTVDSFLLMISSAITRDIYQRTINPDVSEKIMRRASLITTVLVGAGVTLFAVNPPRFLQDVIVFGSSSQAATLLVPMALTLYWPRANAAGTAYSMLAGFVAVGALYAIGLRDSGRFEPWTPFDLHPFVWGLIGSILGGIVGTLATPAPAEHLVAKYFYRKPCRKESQ